MYPLVLVFAIALESYPVLKLVIPQVVVLNDLLNLPLLFWICRRFCILFIVYLDDLNSWWCWQCLIHLLSQGELSPDHYYLSRVDGLA